MTAITGFKCDICDRFSLDHDGWMGLTVHGTRPGAQLQDICSNRCLAKLALDRLRDIDGEDYLAEVAKTKGRRRRTTYTDETKELVRMRAEEVGLKAAAEEFDVPYTTTLSWVPAEMHGT